MASRYDIHTAYDAATQITISAIENGLFQKQFEPEKDAQDISTFFTTVFKTISFDTINED